MANRIADYYTREDPPGFKQFCLTQRLISQFDKDCEEKHIQWLREILVEAKKTFGHPDTFLLPKTPAVKKKRARRKNGGEKTAESDTELVQQSVSQKPRLSDSEIVEPKVVTEKVTLSTIVPTEAKKNVSTGSEVTASETEDTENKSSGEEAPIRRSTRQRKPKTSTAPPRKPTRQSSRKRGAKQTESQTSETETSEPVKTEQVKVEQVKVEQVKVVTPVSKVKVERNDQETVVSSPSLTEIPAKGSPRKEVESYYKNRVKRLINHHESMCQSIASSGDEFTPPKRPRLVKSAFLSPSAPSSVKRTLRTRASKVSVATPTKDNATPCKNKVLSTPSKGKVPVPTPSKTFTSVIVKSKVRMEKEKKDTVTETPQKDDKVEKHLEQEKEAVESSSGDEPDAGMSTRSRSRSNGSSDSSKESDQNQSGTKNIEVESSEETQDTVENIPNQTTPEEVTKESEHTKVSEDSQESEETQSDASFHSASSMSPSKMSKPRVSCSVRLSSKRSSVRHSISKRRSSTYHRHMNKLSIAHKPEASHTTTNKEETIVESSRRLTRSLARQTIDEGCSLLSNNDYNRRKSRDGENGSSMATSRAGESSGDKTPEKKDSMDSQGSDCVQKTPSPTCPANKVVRPSMRSFLSKKQSFGQVQRDSSGQVTSFIKRNTPMKKTKKDLKQEILDRQRREEETKKKLEMHRKLRLEEQRRKREERARKVAEAKEKKDKIQQEKRMRIEQMAEKKLQLSAKQREDKRREELEKRHRLTKKKEEMEERRRQEEEQRLKKLKEQEDQQKRQEALMQRKREYEEQERQRRLEEANRQKELRKAELDKKRKEVEKRIYEQNLLRERELQQRKEEREREHRELERRRVLEAEQREKERLEREQAEEARRLEAEKAIKEKARQEEQRHLKEMMRKEKERLEAEKLKENAEHERLRNNILKQNTSMNATFNKSLNEGDADSYEMTPKRIWVAASADDYGLDDLHSDDSTDDEDAPRKTIPSWAEGAELKKACLKQCIHPPDIDRLFPPVYFPDLNVIFAKKKARFFKRTSSAVWDSPPIRKCRKEVK